MLRSMVGTALGTPYKTSKRRAIDDGATALLAHLLQFELHAAPDTAQVDPHHPVVIVTGRVGRLGEDILDACVVVGCIEPSKGSNSLLHHCFYLRVIRYITADGQCLVTFIGEFFG
jgi:hypothetical protein